MGETDTLKIIIIEEGHGMEDISCHHGSRWIWWLGMSGKGEWMNVIQAPDCDCGEPPRPHFQPLEEQA